MDAFENSLKCYYIMLVFSFIADSITENLRNNRYTVRSSVQYQGNQRNDNRDEK